jgi:hypothetical protein
MPNINKQLEDYYKIVMERGGPTGVFTQAIVDEYNAAIEDNKEEELKNKKINVQFIKSTGQSQKNTDSTTMKKPSKKSKVISKDSE